MSSAPVVTPTDVPAGPVSTETTRPGQYEALLNKHKANTSLITVLFNEVKTCSHKLMSMESEDENAHVEGVKQTVVMLESVARDMQVCAGKVLLISVYTGTYNTQELPCGIRVAGKP